MANPNPSPATRFQPGVKPPGSGRPKAARDKLTTKFLNTLADDFEQHGQKAIEDLREKDVGKYVLAVASVIPKEVEITRPLDGMSDEALTAAIQALTDAIRTQAPPLEAEADEIRVN
jgi:hypothetical protein